MSLLNPARLRSEVEAREARKIKVFEHILDMCYNKIVITNQQTNDCCCIFACPSVVFGMPLFSLIDCVRFIMIKLVEKGFEVHLAVPNNIFISWKKESNPDYSRQMYQLEESSTSSIRRNKLAILPHETYYNNKLDALNNDGKYKLFSSKSDIRKEKEKKYRPIEDYRQNNEGIGTSNEKYTFDNIDLFHSKLDELLA
jgi:hypothetical protein